MQNVEIKYFHYLLWTEHLKIQFNHKYLYDNKSGLNSTGKDVQSPGNKQTKMKILKLYQKEEEKPVAMWKYPDMLIMFFLVCAVT